MADTARQALAQLANPTAESDGATTDPVGDDDRAVIERASRAVEDLDRAAAFVDGVGLPHLERAVERAEASVSASAAEGRDALETLRTFRRVAAGEDDHFRSGRGTTLGGDGVGASR